MAGRLERAAQTMHAFYELLTSNTTQEYFEERWMVEEEHQLAMRAVAHQTERQQAA